MSPKRFAPFVLALLLMVSACAAPATPAPEQDELPGAPAATDAPQEPSIRVVAPTQAAEPFLAAPQTDRGQPPSGKSADDMFFENYGVNPSIDTEDDNLSTFGLDVDTGSYTIARNYINAGDRPPSEAIRVEEFIKYFEQG